MVSADKLWNDGAAAAATGQACPHCAESKTGAEDYLDCMWAEHEEMDMPMPWQEIDRLFDDYFADDYSPSTYNAFGDIVRDINS